jgi:leucyl/phenylalanyl-tRNA---protein transferase
MFILNEELSFPPVTMADEDGLLAIGGDLSTERLLLAYKNGIFPWYGEDEPICWWSPDPRFVLFPAELKVSKSMQKVLRERTFHFTVNQAFEEVIRNCSKVPRKEQGGTWINETIVNAYTKLHQHGIAHSAEAWAGKELVGGLYGVRLGNIFFGESMFSTKTNASKFAFINFVKQLQKENIAVIDCQVYTQHLESLGAQMIERDKFISLLSSNIAG